MSDRPSTKDPDRRRRVHWAAWFEADYRRDTRHFSCAAQDGIYKNLLHDYLENGPPKDDDDELRAIARATPEEWAAHWPAIKARFFTIRGGRLYQKRAERERNNAKKLIKAKSAAGKASASARWGSRQTQAAPAQSESTDSADLRRAVDEWNLLAGRCNLDRCQSFDNDRKKKLRSRLRDCGGVEGWLAALAKVEASSFCRGGGSRGWRIGFDDVLSRRKFTKLLEGGYDDRPGPASSMDAIDRAAERLSERGSLL